MGKARNIAFIVLIFAALGCVIVSNAAASVFGAEQSERSYLEGRLYQVFPDISVQSFMDETLQDETEAYLSDSIPYRNDVVLWNAALQRASIESANLVAGYEVYPTFFGSDYLVAPRQGYLYEMPYKQDEWEELCDNALPKYQQVMDDHSDICWRFAMVARSATTEESPAASLVSDNADIVWFRDKLTQVTDKEQLVDLSDLSFADGDYFATDHHLTIQGGQKVYRAVAASLGIEPIGFGDAYTLFDGPFYGSLARGGLDTRFSDIVEDVHYEHGDYQVWVDGKEQSMSYLAKGFSEDGYTRGDRYSNAYAGCFHGDPGLIEVRNDDVPEKTLLIVGDSYSNNMERFFAESYSCVYVLDLRHYDGTLNDFLDDNKVDDCVFICASNDIFADVVAEHLMS